MNNFKKLISLVAFIAILALGVPASAQVILTSTTLNGTLNATSNVLTLTSATGVVAPGFNTPNSPSGNKTLLVVDGEAMDVVSVNGTFIGVVRGTTHSRAQAHNNLATVWVVSPNQISQNIPQGACNSASQTVLPRIVLPGPAPELNGAIFDCLGVSPNGQWVQTNAPGTAYFGSTVASSAGVNTPTALAFKISGTNAITGFTVPNGLAAGMCLTIVPSGIFTTTTATNISLATTAVVGKTLLECWDGSKFNPSY